jgi:hypothetical protein
VESRRERERESTRETKGAEDGREGRGGRIISTQVSVV